MIVIANNRIANILASIRDCESEAYAQAIQHEEGSVRHGSWMRVAAALTQAIDEFDD